MTGIQTIHTHGTLGGGAELRGPVLHADYQPGAYEVAALATCALGCAIAAFAAAFGAWHALAGSPVLALVSHGAGLVALGASAASWASALRGLLGAGERRIQLARGWVEDSELVRYLRDATVIRERAAHPWAGIRERLSLRFPDGTSMPVVEGRPSEVEPFALALAGARVRRTVARQAA